MCSVQWRRTPSRKLVDRIACGIVLSVVRLLRGVGGERTWDPYAGGSIYDSARHTGYSRYPDYMRPIDGRWC